MRSDLTDQQLVKLYLDGAEEALDVLFQRHLKSIYNFIYRLVGNSKEAEDLTQETFIKVWKNLKKFKLKESFTAWLYRIARNTAFDALRKKKILNFSDINVGGEDDDVNFEDTIGDQRLSVLENISRQEKEIEAQKALSLLTADDRQVVILRYFENLSFNEVAEATGEPLNTIKSRCRRALFKLKKILLDMHQ